MLLRYKGAMKLTLTDSVSFRFDRLSVLRAFYSDGMSHIWLIFK